ncbi:unnamed protein product, partial [marine sediment metagenome]
LLSDQKILRESLYQDQIREVIERLGADPDEVLAVENDKNIEILMNARTLVDRIVSSELWKREENGQYKIHAKMTAITVMTASLDMMNDYGLTMKEPTPYYAGVHAWLGIPVDTLRRWWKNRIVIMRERGALALAAVERSILKNIEISEIYLDALLLTEAELKAMKKTPQGLIAVLKVSTQTMFNAKMMVLSGETIADVGQKEVAKDEGIRHGVAVIVPTILKLPP